MSVLCGKMVTLDVSIAQRIFCAGGKIAETEVIRLSIRLNSSKEQLFQNQPFTGSLENFSLGSAMVKHGYGI